VIETLSTKAGLETVAVCQALGVSRSGFYDWRENRPSDRQREDERLKPLIRSIFWKHKRRYGARRIAEELRERGAPCGVDRVAKLLKTMELFAIQPKSFRPRTTESRHRLGYNPNLLLDRSSPRRCNEVWVGDITYIPLRTSRRFAYLAMLMDLYSRRIVGWDVRIQMTEPLVLAALRQAIGGRQPAVGLVHHTDRGGQYAGREYRKVLRRGGIEQSMSRAANCKEK
jgi:putative transposase